MKIAFFGTPRFAQIVLEKLIDTPYKPDVVITSVDTPSGRGKNLEPSPVKITAQKNAIQVKEAKDLSTLTFDFDLGILAAFGHIIPEKILTIPKHGIINVHPSLLPEYRGPSPIQTAILDGKQTTGVSIMLLDKEIDHGPIIAQQEIAIDPEDNNQSLHEKLGEEGAKLLLLALQDYISGKAKPAAQNHTKASFTKHIEKNDGLINLNHQPTHEQFDRMVRAYYPWPGVWTEVKEESGKSVKIKFPGRNLIQAEGKRPMSISDFKNGYPHLAKKIEGLMIF